MNEAILFTLDSLIVLLCWFRLHHAASTPGKLLLMTIMSVYGLLAISDIGQILTEPDWVYFSTISRQYIARVPLALCLGGLCTSHVLAKHARGQRDQRA